MITTTRAHETRVTIDTPIEEVWAALTEAGILTRWFAPQAEIVPGAGGSFDLRWDDAYRWKSDIEVWEPDAHLRLGGLSPAGPQRLFQDFYLTTENGQTVLRLVHSGFGDSASWDQEYEGTLGGWPCVFFCLKHMLERHRRSATHNFSVSGPAPGLTRKQALDRLEQFFPVPLVGALERRFERVSVLPGWHDSLFSRAVEMRPGGPFYWSQVILYDFDPAESARIEAEWREKLKKEFGA